ncbi:MAG: hypothetical protein HY821_25225 [Acidobacteria bacterium]|nr:hypothetical protein [Acidobacteriota bacterium]
MVEITPPGKAPTNLYYHFSNFTADNRVAVFYAETAEGSQIFGYDVEAGKVRQLTSGQGVSGGSACPHPKQAEILYYMRGMALEELNTKTGALRKVGEIPGPKVGGGGQPTFTPDLKKVTLYKQRDGGNWEIGLMDLATGAWQSVVTVGFRIGHVQHHPSLPMIFYVWETGGYAPQRSWLVNDDGTANRPFYAATDPKQWVTPLKEWMTHESWIPQTGQMTMVMDKVGILIVEVDGKSRLLPGVYWHGRATEDGKQILGDDFDGNLYLIDPATGGRRLLASGLRDSVRPVHAHASFDRSGRYVLFNTGRTRQTVALIDLKKAGIYSKPE